MTSVCQYTVPVFHRLCIFPSAPLIASYSTEWYQTPRSRVFLDKPTFFQLVTKFPAFYETRRFVAILSRAYCHFGVSQINPVNVLHFYFLKIYFNILPTACRFSSCLVRFLNLNPVCVSLLRRYCPIPRPSQPPYSVFYLSN